MACNQYTKNIQPTFTETMVELDPVSFNSLLFSVSLKDQIANTIHAFESRVTFSGSAPSITPFNVQFAGIGDNIDYELNAIYNPVTNIISITVTNNHINELRVDVAEIGRT